jgi:hypothetical protein
MLRPVLTAIALVAMLGIVGCTEAPEPMASTYSYTFEEANDTPQALAATLFHALTTDDEALWQKYTVTFDELKAYLAKTRRSTPPDENIRNDVERMRDNFAAVRDEMRFEHGVRDPDRIRVLRAVAPYYSREDSVQRQTGVHYTYQDHFIGSVVFRKMIKTERGWVLVERINRNYNDVGDLVPLGMSRR